MLGKQRNQQAIDQQFMESAWKNMAEILDQEMPVEKKERRIGWLSIAAILVIGFVGGLSVMWGLQKHESFPMAAKELINNGGETDIAATQFHKEENPILTPNNNIAYNSKTTIDQQSTNSSSLTSQNSIARTSPKEQISIHIHKNIIENEIAEKPTLDNTPIAFNPDNLSLELTPVAATAMAKSTDHTVADVSIPIAELPTLGLTNLPTANTVFSIDNDIDLPKNKKWRTGVYVGTIVSGTTGNGLEAGMRLERKLGAKWAVETGLGFRARQLAFLNKNNDAAERLTLDDGLYLGAPINNSDPDSIPRSVSELQEVANTINADMPDYQLTVPLSVIFRPTGKLRLALGMSWAYRLNKLKDASSFGDPSSEFFSADKNSFSDRLDDFRLNFGVGYYLNPRTGLELAYSEQLNASVGANDDAASTNNDASERFFQLNLVHYF